MHQKLTTRTMVQDSSGKSSDPLPPTWNIWNIFNHYILMCSHVHTLIFKTQMDTLIGLQSKSNLESN